MIITTQQGWRAGFGQGSGDGRTGVFVVGGVMRAPPGCGVALDRGLPLESFINQSTGILQVLFPMTWLGVSDYELRECQVPGVALPPRFEGRSPTTRVRVLHRSSEAMDLAFIRSGYGAPCVAPIQKLDGRISHPSTVHSKWAPYPPCGVLGTSHTTRETVWGPVALIVGSLFDQRVIDSIAQGNNESSLAYTYLPKWAPEGATIENTAGKSEGYDLEHVLSGGAGRINHMLVALPPGVSRGEKRAAIVFDTKPGAHGRVLCLGGVQTQGGASCGVHRVGYGAAKVTSLPVTPDYSVRVPDLKISSTIAASLGLAADVATISLADSTPTDVVDLLTKLLAALGLTDATTAAAAEEMGAAQATIQEQAGQLDALAADLAKFKGSAGGAGQAADAADKSAAERTDLVTKLAACGVNLGSAADVGKMSLPQIREAAVKVRYGDSFIGTRTGVARDAFVSGAVKSILANATKTAAKSGVSGAGAGAGGGAGVSGGPGIVALKTAAGNAADAKLQQAPSYTTVLGPPKPGATV